MSITLELEPSFVLAERIPLTAEDLRYGLEHFFLKKRAVIDLAVDQVRRGTSDPVLHELAALLGDEVERVPEVLDALDDPERTHDPRETVRKWLYLQLKAAYSQRGQLRDPLGVVEQIYADFDYPPSVSPLVRNMPVRPGDEPGKAALIQSWARFLEDEHRSLTSP
ncbi:DUF2247 family protein [Pseudarthrobacter sp. S9]|uniref:DUF2247 family protein n=1 Tax=Pseudarthrobacter sp. S9 TaxID=3418421 RepID=UPI003D02A5C2